MNSNYSYDNQGQTWPIFALALASVVVVPVTINAVYTSLDKKSDVSKGVEQKNVPAEVQSFRSAKKRNGALFSKTAVVLAVGWGVIAYLVYTIINTEVLETATGFDPYEILGIDFGTDEKKIKSVFRKLSAKMHPDKLRGLTEDEMKQKESEFVMLQKAYQALTNEESKENYEKFGNPDGQQATSHGIALPQWLIEGTSSPLLLAAYIAVVGFVLPYFVSQWWSKSKKMTKKGIRTETASMFVEQLLNQKNAEIIRTSTIMRYLAQASEYEELLPGKTVDDILNLYEQYLQRKSFNKDVLTAVSIVPTLINGLVDIAASFRNLDISLAAVSTLKHFLHALPESPKNELLQLPNVDAAAVAKSNVVRLGKLFTLPKEEMKKVLGINDDAKLTETLSVASQIPRMEIVKAEFKVPGESIVTPQSQAYISLKVLIKSPSHHGMAKVEASKLEEVETMETLRDPFKVVFEQPPLPMTYAPYFPELKQSGYIAFVVLQKDGKICEQPVVIKHMDLSNLELSNEEFKEGKKLIVGTLKIPMTQPAPKDIGKIQFRVIVKSLDYFTTEIDAPLLMEVQEPPKLEEVDYDIPVLQADTLAGAMATLRGEQVQGVDDDDSDFEFEEDEDFTDIDSDTDAED